jgi:hypothetical protein
LVHIRGMRVCIINFFFPLFVFFFFCFGVIVAVEYLFYDVCVECCYYAVIFSLCLLPFTRRHHILPLSSLPPFVLSSLSPSLPPSIHPFLLLQGALFIRSSSISPPRRWTWRTTRSRWWLLWTQRIRRKGK